jgi:pilus assembly protein Flp/PilA
MDFFTFSGPLMKGIIHMSALCASHEKGQGLVEYALILVLVGVVVIAALMVLGPIIGDVFSDINSSLSSLGAAPSTPIPSGTHVSASGGVCPPGSHYYHTHSNGTTWCIQD